MTGTSQHPTSGEQEVLMAARRLLSGMSRYGHVEVAKQPVLVAAILLALSNPGFTPAKLRQAGHTTGDNNADTGGGIVYQAARQHLENTGVPQGSISTIMGQFMFLKNDTRLSQVNPGLGESVLSWVCRFTREHLYEHATGERVPAVDALGFLYRESAAAGGGDGVALGIVLTPPHITALMADLISIGSGDSVLDPTCGTGSLLLAAEQAATRNTPQGSRELVLCGVELQEKLFTLATVSMVLRCGVSHIMLGSFLVSPII